MPSQITPAVTDSSASTAPIGPGERWPNGAIALNTWVTYETPAVPPAAAKSDGVIAV